MRRVLLNRARVNGRLSGWQWGRVRTSVAGSSAMLMITTEGVSTVTFFATDNAGNVEQPAKTLIVQLDETAPTVTLSASVPILWPPGGQPGA
jgi:hypothetical protein